jgi:hypothetical protein
MEGLDRCEYNRISPLGKKWRSTGKSHGQRKELIMKKKMRRLNLNRETLGHLQNDQLEQAAGGFTSPCCTASGSCPPPPTGHNEASCLC